MLILQKISLDKDVSEELNKANKLAMSIMASLILRSKSSLQTRYADTMSLF